MGAIQSQGQVPTADELKGGVRDNDTKLQFCEKHRAEVLHHLIPYCALDLLLEMPFGILLSDVPCLELVCGQRGLLLHGLVVCFGEREHRLLRAAERARQAR